jgi:alpha-glucosidase
MAEWWKDAVFYQIYPRSFADSNGDGVGDLPGIVSRLDYLADLGVDALWISPFFPSPMKDYGYDVADYRGVDPVFGSLADFGRLLAEAHRRGIRVVLDLVANHSSDEHPWFKAARASKDAPEHAYYIWKPLAGKVPNNWTCVFELRSAWFPNEATGERYLATFTRFQPEFDWRNPDLRREIYDIMRYWYDLGVDGFRLDVATAYFKDADFRSNPFSWRANPDLFQRHLYDRNQPEVHGVFREMRRISDEAGDRMLIGETHGQEAELAASCHGAKGDGLHMAFNFDFLNQHWSAEAFRRSAERWYALLPEGAWPNFTLSNHDQPRAAFRFRDRDPAVTEARARVAAAMLLTLRGTPFVYFGEELAMQCERIPKARLRDPLGIKTWPLAFVGRDPERTPMQWDASANAGFGSGAVETWLPLNSDWRERNVAAQEGRTDSMLSWYQALLRLRRERPSLREGAIRFFGKEREVLAFERGAEGYGAPWHGEERTIVLLNFAKRERHVHLPEACGVLLASGPVRGAARVPGTLAAAGDLALRPGEALIVAPAKR